MTRFKQANNRSINQSDSVPWSQIARSNRGVEDSVIGLCLCSLRTMDYDDVFNTSIERRSYYYLAAAANHRLSASERGGLTEQYHYRSLLSLYSDIMLRGSIL